MLEKYTKKGLFKLSSGQLTDTFYDVQEMLAENLRRIRYQIPRGYDTYTGIATGGAILASHAVEINEKNMSYPNFVIINKEDELKGKVIGKVLLIDDVVTTENSVRRALQLIPRGHETEIFCVVDRRKPELKSLKISSIYQVPDRIIFRR